MTFGDETSEPIVGLIIKRRDSQPA